MKTLLIRFFDVLFASTGIILLLPIFAVLYCIGLCDTGSPIFRQTRLGKDLVPFTLIKFRTMGINTKSVATHLANQNDVTTFGRFLRKSKLDELPQLWNVLKGDMSLVGPRPNLPTQDEIIESRNQLNVYRVRPGITGLAQIQNIDMSNPQLLARTDAEMIDNLSLKKYFRYILLTIFGKGHGDNITSK